MIHKAEIIVEQFEQGITIRWNDVDGNVDPSKALAAKGSEELILGKEIWSDISEILDNSLTDRIRIKLEYEELISTL